MNKMYVSDCLVFLPILQSKPLAQHAVIILLQCCNWEHVPSNLVLLWKASSNLVRSVSGLFEHLCIIFSFLKRTKYFTRLYNLSLMFWWLFGEAWLSPVRELTIPVWSGCRPCLLKFLVIANQEWHYGRGLWLWVGIYLHRCWSCSCVGSAPWFTGWSDRWFWTSDTCSVLVIDGPLNSIHRIFYVLRLETSWCFESGNESSSFEC